MKLFSTRKPRSYHRISIYTDESRDRLQKLVDDVNANKEKLLFARRIMTQTSFVAHSSTIRLVPKGIRRAVRNLAGL